MLDTHGRKYVNSMIDFFASVFLKLHMTANQVTVIAFLLGISTGFFIYFDQSLIACIVLWVSGLLDAVDGAMARKTKTTSPWGTLMDITFDRMVEMSIVIGLALKISEARMPLLILTISILLSMTVFLTVGALAKQQGIKSFYYQAGLAERTEGFILFSLMVLLNHWVIWICNLFSLLVLITVVQRMLEARKMFLKN